MIQIFTYSKPNMYTVFRILLVFVHLLYSLRLIISDYYLIIRKKWGELLYEKNTKADAELLVQSIHTIKKLPKHLVILGTKEEFIMDSLRIIGWCITLGIPYVSLHSCDDSLTQYENVLKKELHIRRPELAEYISSIQSHILKPNGVNGCKPKTQILLSSYRNNKSEIISLTQNLATAVILNNLSIELDMITEKYINEELMLDAIPDPDLALIFGRTRCTYGILPWKARTTTFYMLPLYRNVCVTDFIYFLEKFNKSVQRYGK